MEIFAYDFIFRALIGAGLVGLAAPAVGVYLVQRRLSLMGDGIGHMALTGVAAGVLTSNEPLLTALVAASVGAVAIELLRSKGKAAADVALALIFYGGIALGVFLISLSTASSANLVGYLFGSVLTVTAGELVILAALAISVVLVTMILGRRLFAVSFDEEVAQVAGLKVRALNLTIAMLSAVIVVVAMRVVGLLMVAALMIIPVAAVQPIARSFASTIRWALLVGVSVSLAGVVMSYYLDAAPGATIVLLALGVFAVTSSLSKFTKVSWS